MLVKPAGYEENRAEQVEHHACHQQGPTGIISNTVTITGGCGVPEVGRLG
jgi:hypothetical protein